MEPDSDPTYLQALSAQQLPASQQGMSPNTAGATDREEETGRAVSVGDYGAVNEGTVAVRTLAVSVVPGSPAVPSEMEVTEQMTSRQAGIVGFPLDRQEDSGVQGSMIGRQNATQAAAWGAELFAQRRSVPVWMQRIGAFFQDLRHQQANSPMWMPSLLGSPETPEGQQRASGLFSPEQWSRVRAMEQRAPQLYGPRQVRDESSGGSTQEAVQEEVRKQLQGMVGQLQRSQQEAEELRRELQALRAQAATAADFQEAHAFATPPRVPQHLRRTSTLPLQDRGMPEQPRGEPQVYGGYLHGGESDVRPTVSTQVLANQSLPAGSHGMALTAPAASSHGMALTAPAASSHGVALTAPAASSPGMALTAPTASLYGAARTAPMGSSNGMALTAPSASPQALAKSGVPQRTPIPGPVEGLDRVINSKSKGEDFGKGPTELPKLPEVTEAASMDYGDWVHQLENIMGDL